MNNQQLTLMPDEPDKPQPVWTNSAIRQMLDELTEMRRQRNELETWAKQAYLYIAKLGFRHPDDLLSEAPEGVKKAQAEIERLKEERGYDRK